MWYYTSLKDPSIEWCTGMSKKNLIRQLRNSATRQLSQTYSQKQDWFLNNTKAISTF